MHRPTPDDQDFEKAWRQTIRWMVADVPQRIDVAFDNAQHADDPDGTIRLLIQARDKAFAPAGQRGGDGEGDAAGWQGGGDARGRQR